MKWKTVSTSYFYLPVIVHWTFLYELDILISSFELSKIHIFSRDNIIQPCFICSNNSWLVFKQAPVGREDRSTFIVTRILKQINAVAAITPVGCHHTLNLVEMGEREVEKHEGEGDLID